MGGLSVVDHQRASLGLISAVSLLSDTCSDLSRDLAGGDIVVDSQLGQQFQGLLALLNLDVQVDDERQLSQSVDSVASALHQRSQGACAHGGGDSLASLIQIGLAAPPSPDSLGVLHVASSARVRKCS